MRGKACSVEFMRRLEKMIKAAGFNGHERPAKRGEVRPIVKMIAGQICLKESTVYDLVRVLGLANAIRGTANISDEQPWPTILSECLAAPDPEQLALEAIENGWTAEQVRAEAKRRAAAAKGPLAPPPEGKYRTIVVDPPWRYDNQSDSKQKARYRTMSFAEVVEGKLSETRNIRDWFPEDVGHLYLWVTDAFVGDVFQITRAWGYDAKVTLVWDKQRIGTGNYFRHAHELCVFAVRGTLRLNRLDASTVIRAPATRHSEKPDAFYSLVETCSPGPYLDVFARTCRPGWDVYGDEVSAEFQQKLGHANKSASLR